MAGPDSKDKLVESIIKGGERAVAEFRSISGGMWFDDAPEYFLTTKIACEVGGHDQTFTILEASVKGTRQEAGLERRGGHRSNGRFDIVAYWASDKPRAAIEVKSPVCTATKSLLHGDIMRLCSTLSKNEESSFQFCAFAYYSSVSKPSRKHDNASQKLRELNTRIHEQAKAITSEYGLRCNIELGSIHRGQESEDGAWCIAAIVITR